MSNSYPYDESYDEDTFYGDPDVYTNLPTIDDWFRHKQLKQAVLGFDPANLVGKTYTVLIPADQLNYLQAYNERDIAMTNAIFNSMSRQEVIESEIARLQKELAELQRFGEDNFDAGTVLRISMQFQSSDIIYKYAAIKALDKWYTTIASAGRTTIYTWAELCQWMRPHAVKLEVMDTKQVVFDKLAIEATVVDEQ